MKKIYGYICLILISVILNSFLYSQNLINVATDAPVSDVFLQWPVLRLFIEPFYAFSYYILTLERSGYVFALSSWLFWITAFVIVFSKYKKIEIKKIILYCVFSVFFLVSVICGIIILPVIGPKLTVPADYKVFDVHSHTIASRDNISTVLSSINYHKGHGFTDFFITEHDNTKGFSSIPYDVNIDNIFPGIQIRTSDGISILLLSAHQFKYRDFQDKSIAEMVQTAHKQQMLAVVPHWWKWNRPPLEDLVKMGVDGFEIYNCGYRYISRQTRQKIIDVCRQNNLMIFGTTDWHGLGYMTNVWTLTKKDGAKTLFELLSSRPENYVIAHDVKGSQSALRYAFEPFSAFYYYIINTELKYILSFYMLISAALLVLIKVKFDKIIRYVSLLFSLFFSVALFYFSYILSANLITNEIIPDSIFPAAISLVVIWFIIWGLSDKNI